MKSKFISFFVAALVCAVPFALSSFTVFTTYESWLTKIQSLSEDFSISLYPQVWFVMYAAATMSFFLINTTPVTHIKLKRVAQSFFIIQLILFVVWIYFTFVLQNFIWALAETALLNFAVIVTMLASVKIDKTISIILIPYKYWMSYLTFITLLLVRQGK